MSFAFWHNLSILFHTGSSPNLKLKKPEEPDSEMELKFHWH